jgi:hypothetical protein
MPHRNTPMPAALASGFPVLLVGARLLLAAPIWAFLRDLGSAPGGTSSPPDPD